MGTRMIKNGILTTLACGLLAACGTNDSTKKEGGKKAPQNASTGVQVSGVFSLLDGMPHDLATLDATKPSIIYFVSDTCTVCGEETDELVSHLGDNRAPEKVNIVSIVVGASRRDAQDWSADHNVGWTVGYQAPSENASLLRKYCPAVQTPCVVVSTPDNGVVLAKNGKTSIKELMNYTGDVR